MHICTLVQNDTQCVKKIAPGVYFGNVNGVLRKYNPVQICIWMRICSILRGGANLVEQISTRMHICCAHERNLLSRMYNLVSYFDKWPIFSTRPCIVQCKNNLYIVYFIKLKFTASVATTSSDMPGPKATVISVMFRRISN